MLTGFLIAWNNYIRAPRLAPAAAAQFGQLYTFLKHKWYFDELYHAVFVVPSMWLGRVLWRRGDEGTIDRFGPNGLAGLVDKSSGVARSLQTGYLYSYALVMLIGLAAAAAWLLPGVMGGE
jgi:NADH-quinone oxidoreductase subunit L